jgi:hypothetical protein
MEPALSETKGAQREHAVTELIEGVPRFGFRMLFAGETVSRSSVYVIGSASVSRKKVYSLEISFPWRELDFLFYRLMAVRIMSSLRD